VVWIGSESERARFIDDVMVMWPLSDRCLSTEREVEKLLETISGHHKYLPPFNSSRIPDFSLFAGAAEAELSELQSASASSP
jgi:hypothetical protein